MNKMNNMVKWLVWPCALLFCQSLWAQDEHTHSHSEESMENAHLTTGVFAVYAETQRYELTLKHDRIEPGHEAEMTLYVADFVTNRPLANVELKVAVQDHPDIAITTEPHEPGVYHLHGAFPKTAAYALNININTSENGPDLLQINPVEIGKDPPQPETAAAGEVHEHGQRQWWIYGLMLLAGLGLGLLFRRRPKAAVSIIIVLLVHTMMQNATAHEGHDHENEKATSGGNHVLIPKETQFLFDIRTQRIEPGDFTPAIKLYGTIIPAPGQFANIITPQAGKITSLRVAPGQQVKKGQVLAVIQPTAPLSDRVGVVAETGRLKTDIQNARAEKTAAEREVNRLRSIEDIAAKKDVQAAEARYAAATANLESLQAIASNTVIASNGSITLQSPVAGTVGPFSMSQGTDVLEGTSLFNVTSLDEVYIEAQMYDRDASGVHTASQYRVIGADGRSTSEEVSYISAALEINPTNQSQKVIFRLNNPKGDFKIGEFVTLQVYLGKSAKTMFVPNSALSEINGKPVIFIKENPESYTTRYISIGEDNGSHTIVLKGVDERERYVTEGTYQVKMMMLNQ